MSEHEHLHDHEWWWDEAEDAGPDLVCGCGAWIDGVEILDLVNNPTVKTIINVVIARRDDGTRDE